MDRKTFFDRTRKGKLLGPVLDRSEVEGLDAILTASENKGVNAARVAYMLATTYHETNGTMQPIRELGGPGYLTRMYDIKGARPTLARKMGNIYPGDGIKFSGRGFVQLTWRSNYTTIGKRLGIDLVNNPDLALTLPVAARILVEGMLAGWFTGASLNRLPSSGRASLDQFIQARPIINGTDKAALIASYAIIFQEDLIASGYQ
jgi:putative chitinase